MQFIVRYKVRLFLHAGKPPYSGAVEARLQQASARPLTLASKVSRDLSNFSILPRFSNETNYQLISIMVQVQVQEGRDILKILSLSLFR